MIEPITIPSYAEQARCAWLASTMLNDAFSAHMLPALEAAGHTCHNAARIEIALAAATEILRRLADDSVPLDDGTLVHDATTWLKIYA